MFWIQPPVEYIEPLFRPPSEARSLILQVTNGCSWNKCTYCEMYTDSHKKFRPKPEGQVLEEIRRCGDSLPDTRRVFLADGDAMALSFRRLEGILEALNANLPQLSRVTAYCLPRNLKNKSVEQLIALREAGLTMLYIGIESGDDEILSLIDKGETWQSTREALDKLAEAGIKRSVMLINGLGGQDLSEQHVKNSASLINAIQPEYLATLVLSFPKGEQRFLDGFGDRFLMQTEKQLFQEMHNLISQLELEKTIFRSDHVSNSLALKGVLGRDKTALLHQLESAVALAADTVNLHRFSL